MTAHEQPISYLDSILNEEESRCEYSHQWRNFTISRSGRFKSKNRKRDVVDGKLFDADNAMSASSKSSAAIATGHSRVTAPTTMNPHYKQEPDKYSIYFRIPSANHPQCQPNYFHHSPCHHPPLIQLQEIR
ncbi:uncharacterized protein LOC118737192 isoform X2 [Rhagoletis pomonella]|uniref:uncharacterized protein LOC118737192 isoform X2 n=1 Tax=Rhagoletis pomonella TaxID=28610 RepID=UPI0017838150|nr:uncharacterized protein LOC118737192 isoform X2 [Rhagoletis pomonella]